MTGGFARLSSESPACCSCCTTNDEDEEGGATGLATSRESGLGFGENEGIENVRANAAREGKEAEGAGEADWGGEGLAPDSGTPAVSMRCWSSFADDDDVGGGGGWDSADCHASWAACSSALAASGSNALRTSSETGSG